MEEGINDLDFLDEVDDFDTGEDTNSQNNLEQENSGEENNPIFNPDEVTSDESLISSLLQLKGIDDRSKIKFENEEGSIEEVDWNTLSNEDKVNILKSEDQNNDLDDSEIQLINSIRDSGMSPSEYLQYITNDGINRYIQNNQSNDYQFTVDQYSDEDLFKADFISRMGDVTEEEAQEALEKAQSNETLFKKQIDAIRKEYKTIEEENLRQEQISQEQIAQEQYNQFSNQIGDEISNFTEFSGYDLNLENDDMQMLYDFITGTDAAGNNYFAKALSDPKTLVQAAWFTLNGKQMINDITEYFQKEITKVRKESYEKGKADANKPTNTVYRNKGHQQEEYNLDDF